MTRLRDPLEQVLAATPVGDWRPLLDAWRSGAPGQAVLRQVDERVAAGAAVYPARVFRAFEVTPLERTRVVILGQDPYHGAGQAEGLAFSVPAGQRMPPSLRNIWKELERDLAIPTPASGTLLPWAERGVLLLNSVLTVEEGRPGSHAAFGWQTLTDIVCRALAADPSPKVFMLWGAQAQSKAPLLLAGDRGHRVLRANHPSPLSARRPPVPFIGCGHFGEANRFLAASGRHPVDWSLRVPAGGQTGRATLTGSPEGCPSG